MVQKIGTQKDEMLPLSDGVLLPLIEKQMREEHDAEGEKPTATGSRLRASDALKCARQMGFGILGVPRVEEVPFEVLMAFDVGNKFHVRVQEIAAAQLDAESEVIGDYASVGVELSSHGDLLYYRKLWNPSGDDADQKVIGEIKQISGYGFMLAVGARKSPEGAGPKPEHVCQAAITAHAPNIKAQAIHMIYIDKDKHSIAEWMLDMDTPYARFENLSPRQLAMAEIDRMQGILGRLDDGLLPARHIPGFGRVEHVPDPDSRDDPWNCRYCGWNALCKPLSAKPVSFEEAGIQVSEKEG